MLQMKTMTMIKTTTMMKTTKRTKAQMTKKQIIDIDFGTTLVPLSKVTADNGQAACKYI